MAALVWIGAGLTLAGVAGLGWSVVIVARARQAGEADLAARMARALPINLGALGLSMLGLTCVVVGLVVG